MATSNFYKIHSDNYYVLFDETYLYDEDTVQEDIDMDFEYIKDNIVEYVTKRCEELSFDYYSKEDSAIDNNIVSFLSTSKFNSYTNPGELRSYPSSYLLTVTRELVNDVIINFHIIVNSGYYSNANVDYVIDVENNEDTNEELIENHLQEVKKEVESMLKFLSFETLKALGTFSNGETVYSSVK